MTPLKARLCLTVALAALVGVGEAAAQTPIPPSAQDFAMSAAQSDEYEIQAGYDAVNQTSDPRVRAFAQQMIDDHMRLNAALRQAAEASGLQAPPAAMSTDQAAMLTALQGLTGADFDQTYVRQQVLAHDQAVAVQQSYADGGDDANLRRAAQSALPVIRNHLEMAEQLHTAVGGS